MTGIIFPLDFVLYKLGVSDSFSDDALDCKQSCFRHKLFLSYNANVIVLCDDVYK